MKTKLNNKSGFTLIEVVIALALLAFLSYFTAQSIKKAVQAKQKIQEQMDREVELREAMGTMVRDIQMAFNYRDVNIELYNASLDVNSAPTTTLQQQGNSQNTTTTTTTNPPPAGGPTEPPKKKEEKIVTQFMGEADKVNFSSLSNIRTSTEEASSDQAEIGYYLEDCRSRAKPENSSDCLWRRVSTFIDDKIKEGGTEIPILENVEKIELRYMGPGFTEEWIRSWSSDGTGDASMKGQFPHAVEITLSVLDDRFDPPKKLKMTSVAQLRFPNNPKPKEEKAPADANAPQ